MPYDMEYEGNPALMAGDKIAIVGPDDVVYSTLLMRQKLSYTGGLNATASAVGKTEQGQEFSSGGSLKNSVSRMVIEQANIKILLAEKATIEDLIATNAAIENLYATKATIQDLTAANARIDNLVTTKATVVDLTAAVARIGTLEAGSATVTQLNAANAKIATLETRAGTIDTLLAGNLTAANMQANLITAGTTLIADGSIASAKIISLSVDKILAGDISTNKFRIVSSSGNMLISDNTIQIKDSTRVRVQIGKDASNDYNMYVWDSSGNLMFDATGLKASGIKSKIIRDDMVSDTANINATKIERESLVTRINGATTLLLASKVKLDTENQTLEVAFNSLKSTVTTTASTVTSQGTSISTIQGQIQAKIWQQDITSATNSLDTRISSTETSITALNNAISLKVSTSDFTTYQSTVTNSLNSKANQSALNTTNGNVSSLTTRVSTAESSISVLQNQISLKVEQSDITTAINNFQVGVRNILFASGTLLSTKFSINLLTLTENGYMGNTVGYYDNSSAASGYKDILRQSILDRTEDGEWYTFSFYSKGNGKLRTHIYPTTIDTTVNGFVDGVEETLASDGYKEWTLTDSWVRHTYTFKQRLYNRTSADVLFRLAFGNMVYICMPKLEKGTKVSDWSPAPEDSMSYTDTQISTAKAEIKITTDSISSTVSSVQSSVTSLGTRVTSAESSITSLNSSITLKVNTSDFNSYKTSNDSAVGSKASQTALNTTNGNVTALTTRVSTAESSISVLQGQITLKVTQTDINNSISSLNIGGRNLIANTSYINGITGWNSAGTSNTCTVISDSNSPYGKALEIEFTATGSIGGRYKPPIKTPLEIGKTYSWSVYLKASKNLNANVGAEQGGIKTVSITTTWQKYTYTFTAISNQYNSFIVYALNIVTGDKIWIHSLKLEEGDKSTSYGEAPEDTQGQIDSATTRISTAESTITQLSSSIALKVETSAYNTKMTSLDGSITSLTNRVSAAELKITDSSIVSTVRTSTAYTSDLAAKANQSALNTTNSNLTNLTTRVTSTESSITQLSTQIQSKVNVGDFGTLITQNVSSVRIAVGQIGEVTYLRTAEESLG